MKRGNLKGFGVDVTVDAGVVTLQGRVSTEPAAAAGPGHRSGHPRRETTSLTSWMLRVTDGPAGDLRGTQPPTPPRLDSRIAIANELAKDVVADLRKQKAKGNLKDFSIDVNVSDGVVWLTGSSLTRTR